MAKPPTNTEIATALAAEYAPDLLPAEPDEDAEPNHLENIVWDEPIILSPSFQLEDGIVYLTQPMTRKFKRMVGKGKDAHLVKGFETVMHGITSTRDLFPFEPKEVMRRGFRWPDIFVEPAATEGGWRSADILDFIKGNDTPPDPWELYNEVRDTYQTYVKLPDDRLYDFMAMFIMGTYMFSAFDTYAYVHFNGTASSGKSQNLKLLEALCMNANGTSSVTESSLFRTLGSTPGTFLIDEIEDWKSEKAQTLMPIIKDGYKKAGKVFRSDRTTDDRWRVLRYPTFGPKIFFSIHPIESVIATRCVIVQMQPVGKLIPDFPQDPSGWAALRNKLFLWTMYNAPAVKELADKWSEPETGKHYVDAPLLLSRHWEISKPILVLADYIGGDALWRPLYEWLVTYFRAATKNLNATDRITLTLKCLPRVIQNNAHEGLNFYPVKLIHEQVMQYLDAEEEKFYKSRSVIRNLQTMGFTEKRNSRKGILVQIPEGQVREALKQRQIEPFDEDAEWLSGTIDYQHDTPADAAPQLWQLGEDEDDEQPGSSPWLGIGPSNRPST